MAKNDPTTKGWEDAECVFGEYLKRHVKEWARSEKEADGDDNDEDDDWGKDKAQKDNETMITKLMLLNRLKKMATSLMRSRSMDNFNAPAWATSPK
jgi:hypothetical protein